MIVISDTSVITSLIQIGHISLLQALHGDVLIPEAVQVELLRTHTKLPAFLATRKAQDREMVLRFAAELDLGEAEAIVLAKETKADLLLIDEKLGRAVAIREGLRISGLIGLAVEAKHRGLLNSVHELITRLEVEAGFRVAASVKVEALRRAGE